MMVSLQLAGIVDSLSTALQLGPLLVLVALLTSLILSLSIVHRAALPSLQYRHHLSRGDYPRIRGKIIRTVQCCVVYDSCTQ